MSVVGRSVLFVGRLVGLSVIISISSARKGAWEDTPIGALVNIFKLACFGNIWPKVFLPRSGSGFQISVIPVSVPGIRNHFFLGYGLS